MDDRRPSSKVPQQTTTAQLFVMLKHDLIINYNSVNMLSSYYAEISCVDDG